MSEVKGMTTESIHQEYLTLDGVERYKNLTAENRNLVVVVNDWGIFYGGQLFTLQF